MRFLSLNTVSVSSYDTPRIHPRERDNKHHGIRLCVCISPLSQETDKERGEENSRPRFIRRLNRKQMRTEITITEPRLNPDYFPCIMSNKSRSIFILADARTSERTFSGMVIHAEKGGKNAVGKYSINWEYSAYERLPKGTNIIAGFTQGEE